MHFYDTFTEITQSLCVDSFAAGVIRLFKTLLKLERKKISGERKKGAPAKKASVCTLSLLI